MKKRYFIFFILFFSLNQLFASESFKHNNVSETTQKSNFPGTYENERTKKRVCLRSIIKSKIHKVKQNRILRYLRGKNNSDLWFWVIVDLVLILGGLLLINFSAWLLILILLGLIFTIGFVVYLYAKYFDKG